MPNLQRSFLLGAFTCLLACPIVAQQNQTAERLLKARALYYTPTANGLKSFECKITFDWKDYLTRFGGQPVTDDNPALLYLNATRLSVTDDLNGRGMLVWINTENIPEGKAASFNKIKEGFVQIFDGYFQSWNAYMNGTMVPAPDKSTAMIPHGDGFQLRSLGGKMDTTEIFDKNSLLSEIHVLTADSDIDVFPTYKESPDGLIIQSVRSLVKQPPTAPVMEVVFSTSYAPVSSYQIPLNVDYSLKNVGWFHFSFSGCEVTTSPEAKVK